MSQNPSRRTVLRGAAFTIGGLALGATAGCSLFNTRSPISTVGQVDFARALMVPPLIKAAEDAGTRVFDLELQAGESDLVPQGPTPTWGINGPLLGPTIRLRRGDTVRMNVRNELDEMTTLHWHGMRLPAMADGGPHHMVDPGSTWSPSWTVDQPAATLWYHPHPHGMTEVHMQRGLGGFIIIDDDDEAALNLPREYGVDDFPVVIQDRTFGDDGAMVETERRDNGMLGDTLLVNGTVGPVLEVTSQVTRLRLLNASSARTYNLGFADDRSMELIGTDGGLLSSPVVAERVQLSPGERAEVLVRLYSNEEVLLRSYPQDLGVTSRIADRTGGSDEMDVLLIRASGDLRSAMGAPDSLIPIEPLDPSAAAQVRVFDLGDNRINGLAMDMARIDAQVSAGTIEVWEVTNVHTRPHNFHIHDVQFLVLDIDGQAPPPELAGWKDTIYTPPGVLLRLAMRFNDNPDPDMPYMFHCHLLWHEDQGMMGQFVVV